MAIHFKSGKERLDYLMGKHTEIIPVEVKPVEAKTEDTPKPKKKPQKKAKKKDDGKVQAEQSGNSTTDNQ